eukprot:jgi/Mesvir1/25097/Mv21561-RA.1
MTMGVSITQVAPVALPHPSASTAQTAAVPATVKKDSTPLLLPRLPASLAASLPSLMSGHIGVVGHRGCGKNHETTPKATTYLEPCIRENTVASLATAGYLGADYVEFDVQVTSDGVPVLFHDDVLFCRDKTEPLAPQGPLGHGFSRRPVWRLTLKEFNESHTPQGSRPVYGLPRAHDVTGETIPWPCEQDDCFPTLQEVFARVPSHVGFNIEIKMPDPHGPALQSYSWTPEERDSAVLKVLDACVAGMASTFRRRLMFSSFCPDTCTLVRNACSPDGMFPSMAECPVFFLTEAGSRLFEDKRRNSLDAALRHVLENNLQGIVSYAEPLLADKGRAAAWVMDVKSRGLGLLTYGEENNDVDNVLLQRSWGVDAVIVDKVASVLAGIRERALALAREVLEAPAGPGGDAVAGGGGNAGSQLAAAILAESWSSIEESGVQAVGMPVRGAHSEGGEMVMPYGMQRAVDVQQNAWW